MDDRIWHKHYPESVPTSIDLEEFNSIPDVFEKSVARFRPLGCFTSFGKTLSFGDVDRQSRDFAAYLQSVLGLQKGDRIAICLPNILQYPIALYGALRAGLVVCNVNPLYTPREMEHQLKDSGAQAIVILANMANTFEKVKDSVPVKHVIVTEIGDMLGFPKKYIVNFVVKKIKKMVPEYSLEKAIPWSTAMMMGALQSFERVELGLDDRAFLQYTGGTTGVAKGAELTHGNIVANMQQVSAWMEPRLEEGQEVIIAPLPMYHIFSLTVNALCFFKGGFRNVLIANPRDFKTFVKDIKNEKFTVFLGLNTLFNGLCHNEEFKQLDFSHLKATVAGGMAVQQAVSDLWEKTTGCKVYEGYGLTETSPVLCCNPLGGGGNVIGSIGLPVPDTDVKIMLDDNTEAEQGEAGELWGKGPQVMQGYWERPEETAKVMTEDGWFKTGDIAMMTADGYFKIVDRKKDMILVSGFNVFPNEVEEVAVSHEGILEAAAIGIPDEKSGEVVKLFVVKKDAALTEELVLAHCKENLTGYKVPKAIEFRKDLPKSPVGKILRKELRPS